LIVYLLSERTAFYQISHPVSRDQYFLQDIFGVSLFQHGWLFFGVVMVVGRQKQSSDEKSEYVLLPRRKNISICRDFEELAVGLLLYGIGVDIGFIVRYNSEV